jgi:hypothetical protein
MDEIISYKMCAVKVRNAKLRNYLNPVVRSSLNIFVRKQSTKQNNYVIFQIRLCGGLAIFQVRAILSSPKPRTGSKCEDLKFSPVLE